MGLSYDSNYLNWLSSKALMPYERARYNKLLSTLYFTRFYYTMPMDENRNIDGLELRNEYSQETGNILNDYTSLSPYQANLLEVMVALSIHCDQTIMTTKSTNTYFWFKEILSDIGLLRCTDDDFPVQFVELKLNNLIQRRYDFDGKGGFFYIKDSPIDLRTVDLGTQRSWFLNKFDDQMNKEREI